MLIKKVLLILIVGLFIVPFTTSARQIISLNDGWSFKRQDDTITQKINLPHCWNIDAYNTRNYFRGCGEYARPLDLPGELDDMIVYLKLDGAATESKICIDGKNVSNHKGGYTPHLADITSYIKGGQNHQISVSVANNGIDIPPSSADFTFMGGLYRDVWLIGLPKIHMDITKGPECGFKVTPYLDESGKWNLAIKTSIANYTKRKEKLEIICELFNAEGRPVASSTTILNAVPDTLTDCAFDLRNIDTVDLWSPENPVLYTVKISLNDKKGNVDASETTTAFRTFEFDSENRFLLNGKPYKLRGMCRHQDQYPMGIALTDDQHRRDIKLIKDLGANFIRISHYPQDDAILEMCDRLGLIVWEEVPIIDYVPDNQQFLENGITMLKEMVRTHYNHPSIAMWGYMNEILIKANGNNKETTFERTLRYANLLEKTLKDEDPYRYSTMAFHGNEIYYPTGISEVTDVKGWNLYHGWYVGELSDFEKYMYKQHEEHPNHRLIVSEYGAGSDLRIHSLEPERFDFSIEYQQKFLEHYLPVIEDTPFIAGASHWNFIDFSVAQRSESMPHINNKGIVTNDRRKKDVYYLFAAMWKDISTDTIAHIATRDWPERTELMDERGYVVRPIKIYTNLPYVSLCVNGKMIDPQKVERFSTTFNAKLKEGKNIIELFDGNKILDVAQINLKKINVHSGKIDLNSETLAVNVGSKTYYQSPYDGLTWLPDQAYSDSVPFGYLGGTPRSTKAEISLTYNNPLLQSCMSDLTSYHFDVVDGKYEVELLYADQSSPTIVSEYLLGSDANENTAKIIDMKIFINNKQVEDRFIPARISGSMSMVKKRYTTEVKNNTGLTISFSPNQVQSTAVSAIKIRSL